MTAGVPGLGLSGMLVLISALLLPMHSQHRSTRRILQSIAIAVAIIGAIVLTWAGTAVLIKSLSGQPKQGTPGPLGSFFGFPLMAVSIAILAALVFGAQLLSWTCHSRPTPTGQPVVTLFHRSQCEGLPVVPSADAEAHSSHSVHATSGSHQGPLIPSLS